MLFDLYFEENENPWGSFWGTTGNSTEWLKVRKERYKQEWKHKARPRPVVYPEPKYFFLQRRSTNFEDENIWWNFSYFDFRKYETLELAEEAYEYDLSCRRDWGSQIRLLDNNGRVYKRSKCNGCDLCQKAPH